MVACCCCNAWLWLRLANWLADGGGRVRVSAHESNHLEIKRRRIMDYKGNNIYIFEIGMIHDKYYRYDERVHWASWCE